MKNNRILEIKKLNVLDTAHSSELKNISFSIPSQAVVAIIGTKDSGKQLLLQSINRLTELSTSIQSSGEILLKGVNIQTMPVREVRRRIGMIFPQPNVFPHWSIYDNVLAGYKLNSVQLSKAEGEGIVEENLRNAGLWNELRNDLKRKPTFLSTGQQQCLCIARALAVQPDILLMNEACFTLDLFYADKIRAIIRQLSKQMTVVIASHHPARISSVSDYTLFLEQGELVEYDTTSNLFMNPKDKRTEAYIMNQY
jgi:phosphate transport system ATP-binding protein